MFSNIFISDERKRVVNKFERETIYIIFPFLPLSFSSKFFQDATNTRPRTTISKLLFFERRGFDLRRGASLSTPDLSLRFVHSLRVSEEDSNWESG